MTQEAQQRFAGVTTLLATAAAQGAFPGAVYGVLHRGAVVALEAVGHFTFDESSASIARETSFDLASLTKVVATTAMAMLLWQKGRLDLDALLGELLPGFIIGVGDRRRAQVTLRMVLAHATGLPGYAPFFETCSTHAEVLRAALRLPLTADPGTRAEYSDPGFILLGKALEVLAREEIEQFCAREIFAPLGMRKTRYRPAIAERSAIPPTEDDRTFRHRVAQGEVHDENCYVLGGVSGHAGLFAPALDVLRFAEAMLAPLRPGAGETLFSAEAARLFTHRAEIVQGSSRALGWDTPSGSPSSSGTRFSSASFGHLGYTGTSLWIDPVQDVAVVLLTNRTFPARENRKIQEVRPMFHNLVRELL